MISLPYLNVLRVSGQDATAFLQSQLAADIASLTSGACSFAAYCNPKGQVIAVLLVCRRENDWLIAMESTLAEVLIRRLTMFVMRSKVILSDCPEFAVWGVQDDESKTPGLDVFAAVPSNLRYAFIDKTDRASGDFEAWKRTELQQGLSWLNAGTSERFIPQMLGLVELGAVSFSKGCYPGQEIVARTRYLGTLKRHPVLLVLEHRVDLHSGDATLLQSKRGNIDAVMVDSASPADKTTLVLLVAAVQAEDEINAIVGADRTWPARQTQPGELIT